MAMPSKMLWMERASTMTKLLIEDIIFFSLASALNTGLFFFFFFFTLLLLLLLTPLPEVTTTFVCDVVSVDNEFPFSGSFFWSSRLSRLSDVYEM